MEFVSILCIQALVLVVVVVFIVTSVRVVPENKRLRVYRRGEYLGERGPGLVLLIPFLDRGVQTEAGSQLQPGPGEQIDEQGNIRPR